LIVAQLINRRRASLPGSGEFIAVPSSGRLSNACQLQLPPNAYWP
jgi:hypothetical protein